MRSREADRWKIFDDDDRFVSCLPVNQPVFRGAQDSVIDSYSIGSKSTLVDARGRKKNSFLRKRILRYYAVLLVFLSCARFFEVSVEGRSKLFAWIICKQGLQVCRVLLLYWDIVVSAKLNFNLPQGFWSFITFITVIIC